MKARKIFFLLNIFILFVFSKNIFTQANINLLKSYSVYNFSNESGREIVRIIPSSIYSNWGIAGTTSTSAAQIDWLLIKFNELGTILCETHTGFYNNDSCYSITCLKTSGNDFILAGFYRWSLINNEAAWSMFDTNCNHLLTKKITGGSGSTYRQVITTSNGFALTGYILTLESMQLANKIIATRYNLVGNMIWGFKYIINPASNDKAYSICFNPNDSTFAITGITDLYRINYPGSYDIFILKINSAGIPIWFKVYRYSIAFTSEANKIIALPDGYAVTGWTTATGAPNGDLLLFKTDFNGNLLWSRTWGQAGKEVGSSLQYYPANNWIYYGGYENNTGSEDLLWGIVNSPNGLGVGTPKIHINLLGNDRIYDLKLNYINALTINSVVSTGELYVNIGGTINLTDVFYSRNPHNLSYINCLSDYILPTSEAIPLLDSMPVIPVPIQDSVLHPIINTNIPAVRDECIPTGFQEQKEIKINEYDLRQNYPNPFNPITRIQYQLPENTYVIMEIFNILGEKVATLVNGNKETGVHYVDFDASNLSSGVYYCILETNKVRKSITIVFLK